MDSEIEKRLGQIIINDICLQFRLLFTLEIDH